VAAAACGYGSRFKREGFFLEKKGKAFFLEKKGKDLSKQRAGGTSKAVLLERGY
jgi:hypothetical protein